MTTRTIRIAHQGFWPNFQVQDLEARFPILRRKYTLVHDDARPELVLFSVFPELRMPRRPVAGVPTLFLTGENVVPDMSACDFAISFDRGIDDPRHLRVPNWVQRLNAMGIDPAKLLGPGRGAQPPAQDFCSFVYRHRVPLREAFVRALSRHARVDCPGESLNNMPPIGAGPLDKLAFVSQRRFCVAFENSAAPGYTTEKLPEALLVGAVPLYAGDPLVGLDFNPRAFLDLADFDSLEALADAAIALDRDPAALERLRAEPAFVDDRLPDCAQPERHLEFFDRVFDTVARRADVQVAIGGLHSVPARRTADALVAQADADMRLHAADTSPVGFHGDRHLVRAIARALADATLFVETGSNEGTSLAYAASLRPDLVMRSCEPYEVSLAIARERCAPYPLVRIDATPSPQSLDEVVAEFPVNADERPVFWLDAHFHGVRLPLGDELARITQRYPRGHLFIDDFQVPDRPWFGFDAYPDGTIGLEYLLKHLDRRHAYTLALPRYEETSSTHHPLRGWACLSWGQDALLVDDSNHEVVAFDWEQVAA
jgi:hypothetical protein